MAAILMLHRAKLLIDPDAKASKGVRGFGHEDEGERRKRNAKIGLQTTDRTQGTSVKLDSRLPSPRLSATLFV
jgi:hypothetical protein